MSDDDGQNIVAGRIRQQFLAGDPSRTLTGCENCKKLTSELAAARERATIAVDQEKFLTQECLKYQEELKAARERIAELEAACCAIADDYKSEREGA